MKNEFKSYPEGYRKLMKKLVPWYFGPMREKMMRHFQAAGSISAM